MHYPSGKTHLYAILAHPVAHVRASEFFGPIIQAEKRDAFVVPLHVLPDDLAGTVPVLQRIGNLKGLIITIPHKEAMAGLCDELGPNAELAGAVNTVRFEPDGRLAGDMFDGVGLVNGARAHGIEPRGARILLVGAGGAGRAIAIALADEGAAAITIAKLQRSPGRLAVRFVLGIRRRGLWRQRDLIGRSVLGDALFQLGQLQFELIEQFGAAFRLRAEFVTLQLGDGQLEIFDLLLAGVLFMPRPVPVQPAAECSASSARI